VRITCGVTFSTTLAVTDAPGPFFKDLPTNMVGCFIIGLLADGATALRCRSGAGTGADDASLGCAVAALPLDSAQQRNAPLWLGRNALLWRGLRLGLCGATTTFSSWLQQMGMMLYEGRVAAAAFGVVVGLQAAVMSARPARRRWRRCTRRSAGGCVWRSGAPWAWAMASSGRRRRRRRRRAAAVIASAAPAASAATLLPVTGNNDDDDDVNRSRWHARGTQHTELELATL
jgi:fluoride ion exporter CrcB/FEX